MHSIFSRGLGRVMLLLAGVAVVALGGASLASASRAVAPTPSSTPGSSPSAGSPSGTSSPSNVTPPGTAMVATRSSPLGTHLVDGQGRSLYLFQADTGNTSQCSGACAEAWPPLVTNGDPQVGTGVNAKKLGTITRSDGVRQVTYNGHPLYRFAGDQQPGDTKGQGLNQFGALWWLVSPNGSAITGMPPGSQSATPSGSGSPSGSASPSGSGSASPSGSPSTTGSAGPTSSPTG